MASFINGDSIGENETVNFKFFDFCKNKVGNVTAKFESQIQPIKPSA
jgi:hypothetical protein